MWQKTAGSRMLDMLYSGKLVVGRVRSIVSVREVFTRIGLGEFIVSLVW